MQIKIYRVVACIMLMVVSSVVGMEQQPKDFTATTIKKIATLLQGGGKKNKNGKLSEDFLSQLHEINTSCYQDIEQLEKSIEINNQAVHDLHPKIVRGRLGQGGGIIGIIGSLSVAVLGVLALRKPQEHNGWNKKGYGWLLVSVPALLGSSWLYWWSARNTNKYITDKRVKEKQSQEFDIERPVLNALSLVVTEVNVKAVANQDKIDLKQCLLEHVQNSRKNQEDDRIKKRLKVLETVIQQSQ